MTPRFLAFCRHGLALLVVFLALPAAAQARVPDGFVGMVSDELIDSAPSARQASLRAQSGAGVHTLRQTFDWARIEREPGSYDFHEYDRVVADAAEAGIRVMPLLFNPPSFHSSRPARRARRGTYPPSSFADMAEFAAVVARRYGPRGTLWSERPDLPRLEVRVWQVWNEPNLPVYWASGPNPAAYTRLIAAVGRGIKAVDPRAEIVTAGLPESRLGIPFARFVRGMYRAGGRSAFDTLAVHPYARDHRGAIAAARLARRLMNRAGDRSGGIRVTEFGWSDTGPRSSFRVGARGQAARVGKTLRGLAARRRGLRLRGVAYYKWRDTRLGGGIRDFWGHHTGLLTARGKRKPAYSAFRRAARAIER